MLCPELTLRLVETVRLRGLSEKTAKSYTCAANNLNMRWTPGSGGSPYVAIPRAQFVGASTCHFMKDTSIPDCGQTTSTLRVSDAVAAPTYNVDNQNFCNGNTKRCTVTWNARCYRTLKVTYSSLNYYFRTTSIGVGSQW